MGSDPSCPTPPSGLEAVLYAANHKDIESWTYNGNDPDDYITGVTLKDGKFLYKFTGFAPDFKKSEEVVDPGIGPNQLKHMATLVVYNRDQDEKTNIENIIRGTIVLFAVNNGKDATSVEVIGKSAGLQVVPGAVRSSNENGGFFILNLATADGQGVFENKLHQTFLDTDFATTIETLDALVQTS